MWVQFFLLFLLSITAESGVTVCGVDCLRSLVSARPPPRAQNVGTVKSGVESGSKIQSLVGHPISYNATLVPSSYDKRLADVQGVRSRQAVILFTHLRRSGGTVLEDHVLKPFVSSFKGSLYNCKEGELARFYRMKESQRVALGNTLQKTSLVWRHCPFGVHMVVNRPHVYLTLVRKPLHRMNSWFAYCDRYSPNKCNTKAFASQAKPGESKVSTFYRVRLALYGSTRLDNHVLDKQTFHPNNLEYRLDDNYQTRMLCGASAHDHPVPIQASHLACALRHLDQHYAFMGVMERYSESLCVLSHLLGFPQALTKVKNDKAPTGSSSKGLPADFVKDWSHYATFDSSVHDYANFRLDQDLESPVGQACKRSDQFERPSDIKLKTFQRAMQATTSPMA